jgi:hypothetical protein
MKAGAFLFHLDPSPSPARTVWRIDPLGHDTLRPQLAGVSKDGRAVRFDMFTQSNARLGLPLIHHRPITENTGRRLTERRYSAPACTQGGANV